MGDGAGSGDGTAGREGRASSGTASWRVRIRSAQRGTTLGSGVLLGGDTVLTCAHVLGAESARVVVDFPEIEGAASCLAAVLENCWIPRQGTSNSGDLALLRLATPQPARHSAPLLSTTPSAGVTVDLCGYPKAVHDGDGVAFEATTSLKFGERWQLNLRDPSQLPLHGCSGGPVLDRSVPARVLGITVTGELRADGPQPLALAHLIPVDTIRSYLPLVDQWVTGREAVPRSVAPEHSVRQPPEASYAVRLASWLGGSAPVYATDVVEGSWRHRTLERALALADRARSREEPSTRSGQPSATVPPVGSLDLAIKVRNATAQEVVTEVAQRLNLPDPDPERVLDRLRRDRMPLTLALLGVNEVRTGEASALRRLWRDFAEYGCRQLLVSYGDATRLDQTELDRLELRYRLGQLRVRLDELTRQVDALRGDAGRLAGLKPPHQELAELGMGLTWQLTTQHGGTSALRARTRGRC